MLRRAARALTHRRRLPAATPTLITYAHDEHAANIVWEWAKPRLRAGWYMGTAAEQNANA
jgi:hypothetical protein